jgi:hypothetical protein
MTLAAAARDLPDSPSAACTETDVKTMSPLVVLAIEPLPMPIFVLHSFDQQLSISESSSHRPNRFCQHPRLANDIRLREVPHQERRNRVQGLAGTLYLVRIQWNQLLNDLHKMSKSEAVFENSHEIRSSALFAMSFGQLDDTSTYMKVNAKSTLARVDESEFGEDRQSPP